MQQADPILDRFHPPAYLHQSRQLTIHDEEYRRLHYSLSAALGTNALRIITMHGLHSPQQDANFDAQHLSVTTLDSWVNGRDLPEENSISNVVKHGGRFRINDVNKGAVFRVGQIDLDPAAVPQGLQQYEFIHFKLATGRSFVVDPQQVGAHGIPSRYDSIVIHKPLVEDVARDGYYHEYILSDENRIYADYVVNFVVDVAQLPIRPSPNADLPIGGIMCPQHPSIPLQFWDPVTHVAVCVYCKMQGSHSHGENASHKLTALKAAHQASMQDLQKEHEVINDRCNTINTQLASIAHRMEAINNNHQRCHDQIYEIVQRVVQVLHEETQSKLSALLSDEAELKRQLEQYQFMDNFLGAQQRSVDPVDFLQAYRSHSAILADMPSEIVDTAANAKPDITVVGRMDLVVDDTNPASWDSKSGLNQSAAAPQPTVGGHHVGSMSAPPGAGHPPGRTNPPHASFGGNPSQGGFGNQPQGGFASQSQGLPPNQTHNMPPSGAARPPPMGGGGNFGGPAGAGRPLPNGASTGNSVMRDNSRPRFGGGGSSRGHSVGSQDPYY